MNWEFAALAILAAALISGFLWYERTHPGSRMLALVATLAGLAAIGRIAFAPIPNVKPTTDIIFIAGFALGGAPGFVVGAVAALASNLLFGQGPWTPWQMVAWGLCGVFGAIIGRVTGQQIGRIPLALLCGAAGLGFGAIMDGSIWVTYAGGQGITQYLTIRRPAGCALAASAGRRLMGSAQRQLAPKPCVRCRRWSSRAKPSRAAAPPASGHAAGR